MLFLVKLSNAYGNDVLLKHFVTKPAARGFSYRFNKLMEKPCSYVEELEDERCLKCDQSWEDIIRNGTVHDCEV